MNILTDRDDVIEELSEITLPLESDFDVLRARRYGTEIAESLQLVSSECLTITIVISEIARNTVLYGMNGRIALKVIRQGRRLGLLIVVQDQGPGIRDLSLAMRDGYTTSNGLGVGLPGAKRLMDEFEIVSEVGKGTTITMRKWGK